MFKLNKGVAFFKEDRQGEKNKETHKSEKTGNPNVRSYK